ncbi:MAG: hypothetical protein ACI4EK_04630 [Wujia sp.]
MKVRMNLEQPDMELFLDKVIHKYHFQSEDKEQMRTLYAQMREVMSPCAIYRINNRMRHIPLIDNSPTAVTALTLGDGVDELQEILMRKSALSECYMIDCMANELLLQLYTEFNKLYPKFHRRYVQRYLFVGDDIPMTKMQELLLDIDAKEEITANEYGVLQPTKSVVFFAILSDNPSTRCEGICMNCHNEQCENRMQEEKQMLPKAKNATREEIAVTQAMKLNYGYQRIFEQYADKTDIRRSEDGNHVHR